MVTIIESFEYCSDASASRGKPHNTKVFGTPLHITEDALIQQFQEMELSDFLSNEARHSVGNYLTVAEQGDEITIITSPGYCGGYFYEGSSFVQVATTMARALQGQIGNLKADLFGMALFLSYGPGTNFNQLPLSTMFNGLTRFPAAACLTLKAGKLLGFQSYLLNGRALGKPASLSAAFGEMMESYAHHVKATETDTTLMFSGGADSLLLYLLAERHIGADHIKPVVAEWPGVNGFPRARAVSTHFDMTLKFIPPNDYSGTSLLAHLKHCLSQDIIAIRAPHTAVVAGDPAQKARFILHGQNIDALALNNMNVLHKNYEKPLLSTSVWATLKGVDARYHQFNSVLRNIQFTQPYLNDPKFQELTAGYFSMIRKNTVRDPNPGQDGVLRGLISSQYPNVFEKAPYPMTQRHGLDREIKKLRAFFGPDRLEVQTEMDMVRHYCYSQLSHKRISTFRLPDASEILLPHMCGPLITYFIGKRRELSDALRPKGEVFDLVEELAGLPYSELAKSKFKPVASKLSAAKPKLSFGKRAIGKIRRELRKLFSTKAPVKRDLRDNSNQSKDRGSLVAEYRQVLRSEDSLVLKTVKNEKILAYLTKVYGTTLRQSDASSKDFKPSSESTALYIINLELILASVAGSPKLQGNGAHPFDPP